VFSTDQLLQRLMVLPLIIISLSVHEWAHAWSAWKLGDDTAARMGRLTLNPLAHIDLFGTILLPLAGVPFGWAKPVPVDPTRFRRDVSMGAGMAITASAGPLSNVVLAVLCALGLGISERQTMGDGGLVSAILFGLLRMNVGLALFNLLPVPPLDGSRVVAWLMPYRLQQQWHALEQYAPFLLLAVFFYGGRLVSGPISFFTGALLALAGSLV